MLLSMTAKQSLGRQTKPEQIGYAILDSIGVDYIPQYVIGAKFCVDAFVPSAKLVVQFDGNYWHGHPALFPTPDARQQRRMSLDRSQDAYMAASGFRVVRVWECDLLKEADAVRHRLLSLLEPQ